MRKRWPVISTVIACVCVLILSGIALAAAPATPKATPSPSPTSGKTPPPPPVQPVSPLDTSGATDAIQGLCLTTYPNICAGTYAGEVLNPNAPFVIYLRPGDDTAFLNALHALLASPRVKAYGPEPAISIARVPHSEDDFNAAKNAFIDALPQLKAQGFVPSESGPNVQAGTYEVSFTSVPQGMTAAAATDYMQRNVSPLIDVVSINGPQIIEFPYVPQGSKP